MQVFLDESFLLSNKVAEELYHDHAAPMPILDYHCHLPPKEIADNRAFENLTQIWLSGDHYKWRAMRANGVPESCCTGDASDWDKFAAFARTVPYTLRNPLYHWTHLELKRYFGITKLLNEDTAQEIWDECNEKLKSPEMTTQGLLKKFNVAAVCTTDDPTDPLEAHRQLGKNSALATRVYPTFRPDKAIQLSKIDAWNAWVQDLGSRAGATCSNLDEFLEALRKRHDMFHEIGCRLSDHGLKQCLAEPCNKEEAEAVFVTARSGLAVTPKEGAKLGSFLMHYFGILDAEKGWTKQLHVGAMRNNNRRQFGALGPDTGFDSIGDWSQAEAISAYLDSLERTNQLPKMVLYNLNPADNYVLGALVGNFQDGSIPGKIQFGSGWWFLDQKEGMTWQMDALSNLGLLRRFVGMLTDSRSFLSFTRHEYFRRILCNLIGTDVENGELPHDMNLLGAMVREICFENARDFFGLELAEEYRR